MAAATFSTASFAQDAAVDEEDEVVATGIRQSLQRAQDIKRDADTFVDSITASDIGALPDRSVLEALQRVPGVSISRFAAGDDPDHFSVEGSGVVIRGLSYVRSEFNGRDAFTANNGRALGFADVPPELVGGVDVFKNQTADMIEGGISGVVNLKTLVPFDRPGRVASVTVEGTYTDLAEEWSPSGSAQFSDRWDTKNGEFGLLGNISYSNLKSRSDGSQISPLYPYDDGAGGTIAAPSGANIRTQFFDRDRLGVALAGQWASNDGSTVLTGQFIRSEASNVWTERGMVSEEDPNARRGNFFSDLTSVSLPGGTTVPFSRDDVSPVGVGSLFESGVISSEDAGWYGFPGVRIANSTRVSDTETVTSDYSMNLKWAPTDRLRANFDMQYVDSTVKNSDISVFVAQPLDIALNLGDCATGFTGCGDPTIGYDLSTRSGGASTTDPSTAYWRAAMDHFEDSEGDELALRADLEYDFEDGGWFKSVRVGGRFAERDQLTRWSNYNWGNLSEAWAGGVVDAGSVGNIEEFTFDNFRRGDVLTGADTFLFASEALVSDYRALVDFTQNSGSFPNEGWSPHGGTRADFGPEQLSDTVETTMALYARVDFGQDNVNAFGGIDVEGNYGLRIVNTEIDSNGFTNYQSENRCFTNGGGPEVGLGEVCETLAQGSVENVASNSFVDFLPSFNLKLGLSDELIMRFAAARSISRPDVGSLRNFRNIRADIQSTGQPGGPSETFAFNRFIVDGGNPDLRPVKANKIDASLEYYFSDVGSLTASVFYQELEDIISSGSTSVAIGNISSQFTGATNSGDGNVKGFELAYQQFYDFLPGALSGFGMQANYTYVDQSRIPNSAISSVRTNGVADFTEPFPIDSLERLSKHTFNIVGLYESDEIEARLAYNWRSDFLLTAADVITRLPVYNEATGQLDASFKYKITPQFQVGVQGVNLLSEITETTMQFNPQGDRFLRSRFENDRRISLIGSFTF
uniref:TonB-dependent receptor n=1 Tax=Fretibacter rubidus TaxID=570162 RepID=UPI003FA324AF